MGVRRSFAGPNVRCYAWVLGTLNTSSVLSFETAALLCRSARPIQQRKRQAAEELRSIGPSRRRVLQNSQPAGMVERANRVAAAAALGQQRRQESAEAAEARIREQGPPAFWGGDAPPSPRQQPAAQQPPAEDEQANDAAIGSAEQPISDSEADLTDADEDKVRIASDEVCPEDDEALGGAAAGSAVPFSAEQMPGLVTPTPVSGTC